MRYLYHVTTADHLPDILKQGLRPQVGPNSALCGTSFGFVYLCDYHSIPYWAIMLKRPVVLRVRVKQDTPDMHDCNYYGYREFATGRPIPKECLSVYKTNLSKPLLQRTMRKLCLRYLDTVSNLCVKFLHYYHFETQFPYNLTCLTDYARTILHVLRNLDYHCLSDQEMTSHIIAYAESGEYAFTDQYLNTNLKLYEAISNIPDQDESTDIRQQLTQWMKTNWKSALFLSTGGWTSPMEQSVTT